ncbi:hypothetical protein KM043_002905 [Ampulex compressa]|nr:hypothetical protein KM043_002905 [Ampulex compressa]
MCERGSGGSHPYLPELPPGTSNILAERVRGCGEGNGADARPRYFTIFGRIPGIRRDTRGPEAEKENGPRRRAARNEWCEPGYGQASRLALPAVHVIRAWQYENLSNISFRSMYPYAPDRPLETLFNFPFSGRYIGATNGINKCPDKIEKRRKEKKEEKEERAEHATHRSATPCIEISRSTGKGEEGEGWRGGGGGNKEKRKRRPRATRHTCSLQQVPENTAMPHTSPSVPSATQPRA